MMALHHRNAERRAAARTGPGGRRGAVRAVSHDGKGRCGVRPFPGSARTHGSNLTGIVLRNLSDARRSDVVIGGKRRQHFQAVMKVIGAGGSCGRPLAFPTNAGRAKRARSSMRNRQVDREYDRRRRRENAERGPGASGKIYSMADIAPRRAVPGSRHIRQVRLKDGTAPGSWIVPKLFATQVTSNR